MAGLSQGDPEEEIGDWFSQWGLVSMVKKLKVTRQNQVCLFQNLLIFVKTEAAANKNWLNFDRISPCSEESIFQIRGILTSCFNAILSYRLLVVL